MVTWLIARLQERLGLEGFSQVLGDDWPWNTQLYRTMQQY